MRFVRLIFLAIFPFCLHSQEAFWFFGPETNFFIDSGTTLFAKGSVKCARPQHNKTSILNGRIVVAGDSVVAKTPTTFFDPKRSVGEVVFSRNNHFQTLKNIDSLTQLSVQGMGLNIVGDLHIHDSLKTMSPVHVLDGTLSLGTARQINQNSSTIHNDKPNSMPWSEKDIYLHGKAKVVTHKTFQDYTPLGNIGLCLFAPRGGSAKDLWVERNALKIDGVGDGSFFRTLKLAKLNTTKGQNLKLDSLHFYFHFYFDAYDVSKNTFMQHDSLALWYSKNNGKSWRRFSGARYDTLNRFVVRDFEFDTDTLWLTLAPKECYRNPYKVDIASDTVEFCQNEVIYLQKDSNSVECLWDGASTSSSLMVSSTQSINYWGVDTRGCEAVDKFKVIERPLPNSNFEIVGHTSTFCEGDTLKLFGEEQVQQIVGSAWFYGEDSVINEPNAQFPLKFVSSIEQQTVSFKLSNIFGCFSSSSKKLVVSPKPKPNFSESLICGDSAVKITNLTQSNLPNEPGGVFVWDLGDGRGKFSTNGLKPDPELFFYASQGHYPISLQATNTRGCSASVTKTVYFPVSGSRGCQRGGGVGGNGGGKPSCKIVSPNSISTKFLVSSSAYVLDTLVFVQLSEPPPTKYVWEFSNGSFDTSRSQPEMVFYKAGANVEVKMYALYPHCADTLVKRFSIQNRPPGREAERPRKVTPFSDGEPSSDDEPRWAELINAKIYPSPTTQWVSLELDKTNRAVAFVEWRDATGALLWADETAENHTQWDVGHLRPGLYFLTVRLGSTLKNLKLIKQ